jgi:DNA-directed RNA polymerase specialized sigma24 family protein
MRHRFLDQAKRKTDAMVRSSSVPIEELSKLARSDARAEQIRFVKEALGLARDGLSREQASVFWLILTGATLEECATRHGGHNHTMATRLHRARSFLRRACVA